MTFCPDAKYRGCDFMGCQKRTHGTCSLNQRRLGAGTTFSSDFDGPNDPLLDDVGVTGINVAGSLWYVLEPRVSELTPGYRTSPHCRGRDEPWKMRRPPWATIGVE